jgi:branched-chain amino acid transport system substrate-binding protein
MRICRPTYLRTGRRHGLVTAAAVALALGLAACASDHHPRAGRSGALTVYSSLPRAGLSARAAAAVSEGERLALADAGGRAGGRRVRLVELDSSAPGAATWDPAAVEANARRAADDPSAVAYVGELDFGGSAISVPVTSDAGLLQVSPGDGLTTLTRPDPAEPEELPERYYHGGARNFVRLVPADALQADALLRWARDDGVDRLAIVRDDRLFGRELAAEAGVAAGRRDVTVTGVEEARRGAADYADLARDTAERHPDAVLYTGLGDPDGDRVLAALRAALPGARLYGTAALAAAPGGARAPASYVARAQGPVATYGVPARRMLRRLARERGTPVGSDAVYGYAAMRLVLDAIDLAGRSPDVQMATIRAALRPRTVRSLLGDQALDARGELSPARFGLYRRASGRLQFLGMRPAGPPIPGP